MHIIPVEHAQSVFMLRVWPFQVGYIQYNTSIINSRSEIFTHDSLSVSKQFTNAYDFHLGSFISYSLCENFPRLSIFSIAFVKYTPTETPENIKYDDLVYKATRNIITI